MKSMPVQMSSRQPTELHIQMNQAYLDIARGAYVKLNSSYYSYCIREKELQQEFSDCFQYQWCTDPKVISNFVRAFYPNIYTSVNVQAHIETDFKAFCDANLTIEEV